MSQGHGPDRRSVPTRTRRSAANRSPAGARHRQALTRDTLLGLQGVIGNMAVQRAMKLELQIPKNKILRNDGVTAKPLPRKYGPQDALVVGASGVRLESETRGQLEFETGWHRKWPEIEAQMREAHSMTETMNAMPKLPSGRKLFPFPVPHLRTAGTKGERKRRRWNRRKGGKKYERNKGETIMGRTETLELDIGDEKWKAGIQTSESFALEQYESFFKQHEFPEFTAPGSAAADTIMAKAISKKLPAPNAEKLRNFLLMIVNYVQRGKGGPVAKAKMTFTDVKGKASKQAFLLLSRTDFASIHSLLSKPEKRAFRRLVNDGTIINALGVTDKTPVYVKGYGMHAHQAGPTVQKWLTGIVAGKDLLSPSHGKGISGAQGRFPIDKRKGKKHTDLVRFEARGDRVSPWATADKWVEHARTKFLIAKFLRPRKGSTKLKF